jgi:hypothetical protein
MKGSGLVGRTPWSAADALVGLWEPAQEAGQGPAADQRVCPTSDTAPCRILPSP